MSERFQLESLALRRKLLAPSCLVSPDRSMARSQRRRAWVPFTSALAGVVLGVLLACRVLGSVAFAVAWGMWVAVPLGLELSPLTERWRRLLLIAWLPSAIAGLLSFFGEMGSSWVLGGGALYLAFCVLVAFAGLAHALRAERSVGVVCACVGLLLLPVAGAWHLAERMGWNVLGFSGLWAGLTAAHFHFAGFATPILLGLGLERADAGGARLWLEVTLLALGVPSVALGITFSPGLALFGTGCMAIPIWSYGFRALRSVARPGVFLPRVLRGLSALVPFLTMSLAIVWSLSVVLKLTWVDLNQMIRYHGLLNALGFISLGFAAERLELWRRSSAGT